MYAFVESFCENMKCKAHQKVVTLARSGIHLQQHQRYFHCIYMYYKISSDKQPFGVGPLRGYLR